MIVKDMEFTLKDGRKAVIRSPREEDIPLMLDHLSISTAETDFLILYPEETAQFTPEGEKVLFDKVNSSPNEAMLVCLVDGKLAGNGQIECQTRLKTRHRGSVSIALLKDYWGLGIGTRLMEELIHIAERNENLLQLELEVMEGNIRALALYQKLGFRITGVKQNAIRLKDGTMLNIYLMIKELKR